MMGRFVYLKLGLAAVLVFVGAKMLLADVWHVPVWASLLVIAGVLSASDWASLRSTRPVHQPLQNACVSFRYVLVL